MIEAWFDGATEPVNPGGHSAYGVAVKVDGKFVFQKGEYVGHGPKMSNNVAEYAGFIAAVTECLKYPGVVIIRGDSKLVVMQMNGKWKAKKGLYIPYYHKAKEIWGKLKSRAKVEWISRDYNDVCDGLSKKVLHDRGITFRIQPEYDEPYLAERIARDDFMESRVTH